jgi:hypothetical protein
MIWLSGHGIIYSVFHLMPITHPFSHYCEQLQALLIAHSDCACLVQIQRSTVSGSQLYSEFSAIPDHSRAMRSQWWNLCKGAVSFPLCLIHDPLQRFHPLLHRDLLSDIKELHDDSEWPQSAFVRIQFGVWTLRSTGYRLMTGQRRNNFPRRANTEKSRKHLGADRNARLNFPKIINGAGASNLVSRAWKFANTFKSDDPLSGDGTSRIKNSGTAIAKCISFDQIMTEMYDSALTAV